MRVCVVTAQTLGGDSRKFLRSHKGKRDRAATRPKPLLDSIRTDKGCFLCTRARAPRPLTFAMCPLKPIPISEIEDLYRFPSWKYFVESGPILTVKLDAACTPRFAGCTP